MKFFLAIFITFCFLSSCRKEKQESQLQLSLNKGLYEIVEKGEKEKFALDGEYILYSVLTIDNKGTVFFDRRREDMFMREQVRNDSFTLKNLSPVSELIRILAKGDSAILKIPLSKEEKIDGLSKSDTLIFYIKIMDIMNEEQVIDILRKKFEKDREQNVRESRKYLEARDQMLSYIDKLEKNSPDLETLMTSGGIKYLIIDHGEGKTPRRGQKVIFDYISLLEKNKKEIDNSFIREQSAELIAGARQEIIGLDEAIFVMNKAMTAIFFIPSEKAYGKSGKAGIVPPDSDIIYFIRVKEIN